MRARLAVIILSTFALFACGRGGAQTEQNRPPITLDAHATPPGLPSLAPMLAKVSPAVVNIAVQGTEKLASNPLLQDPLFRQFFGIPSNPTHAFLAVGSGIIIDAQHGYVITDNHVIKNAQRIQVTLSDHRNFDAKLVGTDPQTDIAVLKIAADHLTSVPVGTSKDLKVGDYVVAIGDPFGVGQAATFGIVSALGRSGLGLEGYEDFIQTDASINPGNSGGALVNMAGQLVGMNAAILSSSGGNVGIGFAIPVDMIRSIAQELITSGKISRGALGVTVQNVTPALAKALGLNVNTGALVSEVLPGSAAEQAGIKQGDVITALNGKPVMGSSELRLAVGELRPGATVQLTVLRNGNQQTVRATLKPLRTEEAANAGEQGPAASPLLAGVTLGPIPKNDPNAGNVSGVYVEDVSPESAAALSGLERGDIITEVDRNPVGSRSQIDQALRDHPKGRPLLLRVRRQDSVIFIAIQ